jgi:hypothetical protein
MDKLIEYSLLKRTFSIGVSSEWLSSNGRDKLGKFLLAHGAHKVKRTGDSKNQYMYASWINDHRSNEELGAVIQAAIELCAVK